MRRVVVLVAALVLGVACGLAAATVFSYPRPTICRPTGIPAPAGGYSQRAELTGPATAEGFGSRVAVSAGGGTALVGTSSLNGVAGVVYVFTRRGGTWSRTGELTAPGTVAEDDFGSSVAVSAGGSTALVGAPGRHNFAGVVYVFTLRGGTWSQTAELTAAHAVAFDDLGTSVALSAGGGTALVGTGPNARAAYVFTLRGGRWSQTGELTASDVAIWTDFGAPVALSAGGSTALVGAVGRHDLAGAVYVFTLRGGTWSLTAELTASDAAPGSFFGTSVALSAAGCTALVGAGGHNNNAGAAYVFTLRGGRWSQTAELSASAAVKAGFGGSVALSAGGGTALVGAPGRNLYAGVVYVFTLRGGTWSQTGELTASDAASNIQFGVVALSAGSGTALVAGGKEHNSYAGAVYVFTPAGA